MSSVTCSSPETIERFLHSSYDQARRPSHRDQVPAPARRTVRPATPQALAKIEGLHHDGNTVLFLYTHNAGRSQIALGFFTALAGDEAVGWSAGSEPGRQVNPSAVQAMAERGIDISAEFPKPWTDEPSVPPTS